MDAPAVPAILCRGWRAMIAAGSLTSSRSSHEGGRSATSSEHRIPQRRANSPPARAAVFVGSGCAALIYEIVWFQLLQLVIGSSAVSLGVLLGTFMGGMCLGSLLLPRFDRRGRHPLRGLCLAGAGHRRDRRGRAVRHAADRPALHGHRRARHRQLSSSAARCAAVCLLPPTMLMGATLPAIARWVEATPRGVSWLGFFYGGNIAGAVLGCLLAGFYLLRVYDMATATYVAAAINVAVALIGLALAASTPYAAPVKSAVRASHRAARRLGLDRLSRHRPLRDGGARRGGDLDAPVVAACSAARSIRSRSSWPCS